MTLEQAQKAIAKKVSKERSKLGLSLNAYGKLKGISGQTVMNIEAGKLNLTLDKLLKLGIELII
jgi:transcriptional regulator with XRE-family HTH domain